MASRRNNKDSVLSRSGKSIARHPYTSRIITVACFRQLVSTPFGRRLIVATLDRATRMGVTPAAVRDGAGAFRLPSDTSRSPHGGGKQSGRKAGLGQTLGNENNASPNPRSMKLPTNISEFSVSLDGKPYRISFITPAE